MQRFWLTGSSGPSSKGATGQWNESLPICPNIDIVDTLMRKSNVDSLRDFGHALAMLHFKNENAFPGRAPPKKASECLVRRRSCLVSALCPMAAPVVIIDAMMTNTDSLTGRLIKVSLHANLLSAFSVFRLF